MRKTLVWAALCLAALVEGCGGGGGNGPIAACGLDSFTPNYARHVSHLLNWPSFPIRVFFVKDANYDIGLENLARMGFDDWANSTGGKLSYTVAASFAQSDVQVKFDLSAQDGVTLLTFVGLTLENAEITIGVHNLPVTDIICVAKHEFGHALGIDGHSDDPSDLMAPVHVVGQPCPITTRDLNTIMTAYCHVFGKAANRRSVPKGPRQTVKIN